MLGLEVEDVNCEPNVLEKGIIFNHLGKGTVVIEEYVVRFDISAEVLEYRAQPAMPSRLSLFLSFLFLA